MQIHYDNLIMYLDVFDNPLAHDWHDKVKRDLDISRLQRDYCFIGFPGTARDLELLCDELNSTVLYLNTKGNEEWCSADLPPYIIEEYFTPNSVRYPRNIYKTEVRLDLDFHKALGLRMKHGILNQLHLHFETLQGTLDNPAMYAEVSSRLTKAYIGKLNTLCHELESLILSQRKFVVDPDWVRPSQIFSFNPVTRYNLTPEHCELYAENLFDRKFGYVYLHYSQIGKTWFEVWRDEGAPRLDQTTCSAMSNHLYYSCEFDIEWGQDVTREQDFHEKDLNEFQHWVKREFGTWDPVNQHLGHIPLGKVDLQKSFGTEDKFEIWKNIQASKSIIHIIP